MKTCRFCHKADFETPNKAFVRLGTRHNAHWECKFNSLPDRASREAWLRSLPLHRLVSAPFLLLESTGLYEFVSRVVRERQAVAS